MADGVAPTCRSPKADLERAACRRLCFVGSDIYIECAMAAHKLGGHVGGKGKVAVVGVIDPGNAEAAVKNRMFISHLAHRYPAIQVVAVKGSGKYDIKDRACELTRQVLGDHPDLVGIYSNADEAVSGIVDAVQASGCAGRVCVIGYGNEPHIMQLVEAGRVSYALLHNRFVYGYDSLVYLYNKLVAGIDPPSQRILYNPDVVRQDTLAEFWDAREGYLLTDRMKRHLVEPVPQRPPHPLRFALLLEGIGPWFASVIAGAREAEKTLPDTAVEINNFNFSPERIEQHRVSELRKAADSGCDGVVLWVLNHEIIPHINQVVDRGTQVVVFHTEPVDYEFITPQVSEVFASLFNQLTLLENAENRLRRLSNLDELTNLNNRRRFNAFLDQEWRNLTRDSGNHLSLLMLDIDRFKRFNDRHGHLAGDACLRQVAHTIQSTVRRPRDFVARYGGEEFAVVLPDTNLAGARVLAERIRQGVARRQSSDSLGVSDVTLSVGVASADAGTLGDGATWSDLVRRADEALYAAKLKGRNRVESAA